MKANNCLLLICQTRFPSLPFTLSIRVGGPPTHCAGLSFPRISFLRSLVACCPFLSPLPWSTFSEPPSLSQHRTPSPSPSVPSRRLPTRSPHTRPPCRGLYVAVFCRCCVRTTSNASCTFSTAAAQTASEVLKLNGGFSSIRRDEIITVLSRRRLAKTGT